MLLPCALSSLFLPPAAAPQGDGSTAPPGLVLIEGQRTRIGLDKDKAEELILENEQLKGAIIAETPEHEVKVDDFYLMVTEVTNEQYARFVRATGAKPPLSWGAEAIEGGRAAFFEEQNEKRQEAREAGVPYERETFDQQYWWDRNWEDAEWEVPTEILNHAVVFVDYQGATDYARWAGLRLMTEFEYQCAVRGRTSDPYPWGDEWHDKKYAHSVHYGLDKTLPVGSFEAGATDDGIHDLAGGVWEWTSSPYTAYPGYEPLITTVGKGSNKRPLEAYGAFDANRRVAVGGSYKSPRLALRASIRMGADRYQSTDALGFRCAATPTPGLDMANAVLHRDLPPTRRPVGVEYKTDWVVAMDRWHASEGTADVPGYAVIEDYDAILFIPVESVDANDMSKMRDLSEERGIVHLGLLYCTEPMLQPDLGPGTYMVGYRAAGETRVDEDEEEASSERLVLDDRLDVEVDNIVFLDTYGDFAAAMERGAFDPGRLEQGSVRENIIRRDPEGDPEVQAKIVEMDVAVFTLPIEGVATRRGFMFELGIGLEPGALDDSWRRP